MLATTRPQLRLLAAVPAMLAFTQTHLEVQHAPLVHLDKLQLQQVARAALTVSTLLIVSILPFYIILARLHLI